MTRIGFHASHEQFSPKELLEHVRLAEQAGFRAAMCSDHFRPWSERQGQSGFAWAWLGAALQATSLPFGVVTVPGGWRYHPAILAQASATLAQMFPGRFWIAPGSGEALNERVVGRGWPAKEERNARLRDGVDIMRALWAGEEVTRAGPVPVEKARLYTRPDTPPSVIGAAITPTTAEWLGGWADGMITVNRPPEGLKGVIDAFRRGGGEGKPVYVQVHVSYAESEEEARANAFDQWRSNIFESRVLSELRVPEDFDAAARFVKPEDLDGHVRISADPGRHAAWLRQDLELGVSGVFLHNVGRNQREFIEVFGREVLPEITDA